MEKSFPTLQQILMLTVTALIHGTLISSSIKEAILCLNKCNRILDSASGNNQRSVTIDKL